MAKGKQAQGGAGRRRDQPLRRRYRFELLDQLECGIVLSGTEVKSLRDGGAQLKDGYAAIRDGELWLHTSTSRRTGPPRARTTSPSAPRKLLLHRARDRPPGRQDAGARPDARADADLLLGAASRKVEIALAQGKDLFDKRESIRNARVARDWSARCARRSASGTCGYVPGSRGDPRHRLTS